MRVSFVYCMPSIATCRNLSCDVLYVFQLYCPRERSTHLSSSIIWRASEHLRRGREVISDVVIALPMAFPYAPKRKVKLPRSGASLTSRCWVLSACARATYADGATAGFAAFSPRRCWHGAWCGREADSRPVSAEDVRRRSDKPCSFPWGLAQYRGSASARASGVATGRRCCISSRLPLPNHSVDEVAQG